MITIEGERVDLPDSDALVVSAVVRIENKGSGNAYLEYPGRTPLLVTPMVLSDSGEILAADSKKHGVRRASNPQANSPGTNIRVGATEAHSFVFSVPSPGLYLLSFVGYPTEKEAEIDREDGAKFMTAFVGKKVIVVERDALAAR